MEKNCNPVFNLLLDIIEDYNRTLFNTKLNLEVATIEEMVEKIGKEDIECMLIILDNFI